MSKLWENQTLVIPLCSWALAQIIKVIIVLIQEKRIAWNYFITSGGMPSAHSATVTALATSIAFKEGFGSIYFSLAAILAVIVMYDAAGVRQSVGEHSAILNLIIKEFSFKTERPDREKALREFVGHTPFQVVIGALMGIVVASVWILLSRL
jgi:acid phosphatase family membrane protein YuiD